MNYQYHLYQEFIAHEVGNVRCIDMFNNMIITGSNDKMVKVFSYQNNTIE